MFYVTMTDKFFTKHYKKTEGRINKLVFECETYEEAEIVADNAKCRTDMAYININSKAPCYSITRYHVDWKNKCTYPTWYKQDAFRG